MVAERGFPGFFDVVSRSVFTCFFSGFSVFSWLFRDRFLCVFSVVFRGCFVIGKARPRLG